MEVMHQVDLSRSDKQLLLKKKEALNKSQRRWSRILKPSLTNISMRQVLGSSPKTLGQQINHK